MTDRLIFTPIMQRFVYSDTGKLTPEAIAFFRQLFQKLDGVTPTDDHGALTGLGDDDHTQYHTDARALTWLGTRSTDDLPEGATNFYYTEGRFNTSFSGKTTTDLAEGSNLYFTNERVDDRVAALIQNGTGITWTYDDTLNTLTGNVTITQYTDEMAQDAVGSILVDSATIDFTYNDALNTITASIITTGDWTGTFDGQEGSYYLSRANHTGTQLSTTISDFTEAAQDAVGGALVDSSTIDFTYDDAANTITAAVKPAGLTFIYPLMNYGGYGFNGATRLHSNALTGIADSKQFVLFADLRFANNATATERWIDSTGSAFFATRNSAGNFQIQGENAAGTSILNITTDTAVAALAGRYMLEVSCDMAVGITVKVNGVIQTYTITTFTDDIINFATVTEYCIGARVNNTQLFTGDFYRLYLATGTTLDITQDANSRKFYAPDLTPVFMGWQGELVTGSQPALFLAYDSYTNWFRNRGFAVSTNWTETGTPSAVTTTLNGQYAGGRNGTKTRVITAAGAVYVGIADDTVGINKTVGAATTVNLPKATGNGKRYTISDVKGDAGANNITLTPPSGTINGAATLVLNVNYESAIIHDMATDVYVRV